MSEARTWVVTLAALAALAAAWVLIKLTDMVAEAAAKLRLRYWRRQLHRSIVGAYDTRRRHGSNPRFDAAIRAGEDELLNFQPPTERENLTS